MIVELHDGLVGITSDSATARTIWFSIPFESKRKVVGESVKVEKVKDVPYWERIWKPGIARQGALLAVVPLMLQACCLLVLNNALSDTEVLEQKTHEQAQIVAMANKLWLKGLQANANIGFFIMSGNPRYKTTALQNLADFKSILPKDFGTDQNGATTQALWSNVRAWVTSEAPSMENRLLTTTGITDAVDLGALPPFLERAETLHMKVESLLKEELSRLTQAKKCPVLSHLPVAGYCAGNDCNQRRLICFLAMDICFPHQRPARSPDRKCGECRRHKAITAPTGWER